MTPVAPVIGLRMGNTAPLLQLQEMFLSVLWVEERARNDHDARLRVGPQKQGKHQDRFQEIRIQHGIQDYRVRSVNPEAAGSSHVGSDVIGQHMLD
jgi:hypothetical protein